MTSNRLSIEAPRTISVFGENCRWLCWQSETERSGWPQFLALALEVTEQRAAELLWDAEPTQTEVQALAKARRSSSEEALLEASELPRYRMLTENLRFIVTASGLTAKALARKADVEEASLSRWRKGKPPTLGSVRKVARAAGLAYLDDWDTVPYFLSLSPLTPSQKREWITDRLRQLSDSSVIALFPAMWRLLETP